MKIEKVKVKAECKAEIHSAMFTLCKLVFYFGT